MKSLTKIMLIKLCDLGMNPFAHNVSLGDLSVPGFKYRCVIVLASRPETSMIVVLETLRIDIEGPLEPTDSEIGNIYDDYYKNHHVYSDGDS